MKQQFAALQSQVQSLVNLVMNTKDQDRADELGKNLYEVKILKNVVPPNHRSTPEVSHNKSHETLTP